MAIDGTLQVTPVLNPVQEIPKHNSRNIIIILLFITVFILGVLIFLIGVFNNDYGYKSSMNPSQIEINSLINKKEENTAIINFNYENRLLKITDLDVSYVNVCLEDKEGKRDPILLESTSTIRQKDVFDSEYKNVTTNGTPLKMLPYSSVEIAYQMSGDWREYGASYLDYDQLNFIKTDQEMSEKDCEKLSAEGESLGLIPLDKENCDVCKGSTGGADISIIDFIYNDDVIWRDGQISFVPIIKNIGDQVAGRFEVIYYLNGKFSSSFELPGLQPGEIVNNFIAGTGFGGNFGVHKDLPMELKLVIRPLDWEDIEPTNNEIIWDFNYVNKVLPKHTCTYTDNNSGREDFHSFSSIKYNEKTFADACIDEFYLLEYSCESYSGYEEDASLDVFLYDCPEGCASGACKGLVKRDPTPVPVPIIQ